MSALPTRAAAKAMARRLQADSAKDGEPISYGVALDRVAQAQGFRDWNGLSAAAPNAWTVGDRVTGCYLAQPFSAEILQVQAMRPGWTMVELRLDEAVDVVRFDSFSSMRKRIKGVVGPKGTTEETTSDGRPHLELDL